MTRELTPYDRGERCEPAAWVHRTGGQWIAGKEYLRPAEDDDFGRVDFDGDDGTTIVTAYVERGEDEGYTLVFYGHGDDVAVRNDSDAAEGVSPQELEIQRRLRAEQIALDIIGEIDMGQGVARTAVNFAEGIRSGWLSAADISHFITAAALRGLKEGQS